MERLFHLICPSVIGISLVNRTTGLNTTECLGLSGKNTKFYELFSNLDGLYSVHHCDIYHSVAEGGFVLSDAQGNPTTIDIFKRLYGDAGGFDREYGCLFTGDLSSLLLWAELERAAALGIDRPFHFCRIDGSVTSPLIFSCSLASTTARGHRSG